MGVNQNPHQSVRSGGPVRPVLQGPQPISPDQGHSAKGKEEIEQSTSVAKDIKGSTANVEIKIGSNDVIMGDCFKGPIVINGPVQSQVWNPHFCKHGCANLMYRRNEVKMMGFWVKKEKIFENHMK